MEHSQVCSQQARSSQLDTQREIHRTLVDFEMVTHRHIPHEAGKNWLSGMYFTISHLFPMFQTKSI